MNYTERFYRQWSKDTDLVSYTVSVKESDLFIRAEKDLTEKTLKLVKKYRSDIESFIAKNPLFLTSLSPLKIRNGAPPIVKEMAAATEKASVGPMASVAGAISEFVGRDLLKFSKEVIVENGGDIFIKTNKTRKIGIFAGNSPLTGKIAIEILPQKTPLGICTSAGTVGHSLSFGRADAAVVISPSTLLADAVATAAGNLVRNESDVQNAIEFAKKIKGVSGIIIIINDKIGIWGDVKLT